MAADAPNRGIVHKAQSGTQFEKKGIPLFHSGIEATVILQTVRRRMYATILRPLRLAV